MRNRIPGVLHEHRAHALALDCTLEHGLVEGAEILLDEQRHIDVGWQLDGAVIRGLNTAATGERVDDQILWAVGIDGAKPQRQLGTCLYVGMVRLNSLLSNDAAWRCAASSGERKLLRVASLTAGTIPLLTL